MIDDGHSIRVKFETVQILYMQLDNVMQPVTSLLRNVPKKQAFFNRLKIKSSMNDGNS